mmetsp:Transcript_139787/g.267998  ORF Transcript_139787/g.267998 Transcript_139787/m.267998 type:complete len:314 (-) Transcript_139787:28-969(-)
MPIIKEDPLHRYDPTDFSFKKVKGEVSEAMQFDWKRDKVDDAKKRAIYDCKNYDDFKSRVAGCTLRPIHKDEFNAPPKFVYNRQAQKSSDGPSGMDSGKEAQTVVSVGSAARAGRSSGSSRVPRNGHEFEREFRRRAGATEKVALLRYCKDAYGQIFARELDVEVLRQLLEALDEADGGDGEPRVARSFLSALVVDCPASTAGAAAFLTSQERTIIARLLAREPAANNEDNLRICASFGVSSSSLAEQQALQEEDTGRGDQATPAPEAPVEEAVPKEVAPSPAVSDSAVSAEPQTVPDLATETSVQGGYDAMD